MQKPAERSHCLSELDVSFGYQCSIYQQNLINKPVDDSFKIRSNSFSCLSGAALSANSTLANTNICNGLIGEEILPGLDSPKSFRRMPSSPSLSSMDLLSSSQSSLSTLASSMSADSDHENNNMISWKPTRANSSAFLNAIDVQMAGGAAGEDRVQAVCSEENGWLFCGIYDGFNGRDAADFLASTLYENIGFYLNKLESRLKRKKSDLSLGIGSLDIGNEASAFSVLMEEVISAESFRAGVLNCLVSALAQAESDFLHMVEQSMEWRPDIVSIGSCVLNALLYGNYLYVMNLGDSRAVLATTDNGKLRAIELTMNHSVDNELECKRLLEDHPDEPSPIVNGRVKGKLKLTRAFGVGYLKKREMNDALIGILKVRNLLNPPYVYTEPFTMSHKVLENDLFVVLGSDGLFDFFQNHEIVELVNQFIHDFPLGDPAKYLIEQLVHRAAENAGKSAEALMSIPAGGRRKYHDDVTVIVINLGNKQQTSTASTSI